MSHPGLVRILVEEFSVPCDAMPTQWASTGSFHPFDVVAQDDLIALEEGREREGAEEVLSILLQSGWTTEGSTMVRMSRFARLVEAVEAVQIVQTLPSKFESDTTFQSNGVGREGADTGAGNCKLRLSCLVIDGCGFTKAGQGNFAGA